MGEVNSLPHLPPHDYNCVPFPHFNTLPQVRAQLAPWEKRVGEVSSRISVAAAERDMLAKRGDDAQRRLDAALKGLAAAQQSAQAKSRQIQELEAAAGRLR